MRLLSRLVVVLVFCLVAIALPASPTQAYGEYITLSPSSGVPGEEITVYGHNFTDNAYVDIYYYLNGTRRRVAEDETNSAGYFKATFIVRESCTGDHEVFVEDEEGIDAHTDFTVKPGLTVSPEEGPVGTTVTVEGHGFAEDEEDIELRYDDEVIKDDIPADEYGWWQYSFKIPSSAQGSHELDARGDVNYSFGKVEDATFEVTPGISLDKSSGNVGDTIEVTGNGFEDEERDIKILFDGEEAETEPEIIRADENGCWEASFSVPEMPTDTYSVTAEGERTDKEDITARTFEIEPGIVLSPNEGHVGTDLTITGHGFAANKNVVIKYDVSQIETASTNAKGSFSGVSFLVPEGIHGAHQVTAEDTADNEATAIFTMESEPPETPVLISPADGARVGFIGNVRPTFVWEGEEVEDPSGVYYSLQIATSANVTATGEFADPIVSTKLLVGTNYTLEETDALPYGTYYWIVQAVDGAENESDWTEAHSFRAGLLPLWAFIVIIVAIVAGIGALVYFFVIRKRVYYY